MTEPKWHNNGWGFPCACTTGHHTEYITVDTLNALEERINDLEARAARVVRLCEAMISQQERPSEPDAIPVELRLILRHMVEVLGEPLPSTTKETQ